MKRLENKIALITGASQGIGKAIAEVFHQQGALVILTDISNYEGTIVAETLGEKSEYFQLNVKKESDWIEISNIIKSKYGKLDILVNNAGITGFLETNGPFDAENVEVNSWNEVHIVNSTGTMLGCKYAIALMKENGGSIVNISSRSGIVGIPAAVAYASSKAAVRNHT